MLSSQVSLKTINRIYLDSLSSRPVLTKSITAGILALFNETIACIIARDLRTSSLGGRQINHVFSNKTLAMMSYGAFVITPLSHQLYGTSNKIFDKLKRTKTMKCIQILSTLLCIQPVLSAVLTSWLSLVNSDDSYIKSSSLREVLTRMYNTVKRGLKTHYLPILRSSMLTSLCTITIANIYLSPELWVVFFTIVYFFLGTVQNTKVKMSRKKIKSSEAEEK